MTITVPEGLRASLEKKRLIFTVTTGRSGTAYLARILGVIPDVASFHEPEPRFSEIMRSVQQDTDVAYEFWINKKLPRVASERAPIYVETSHLFCKGFVEPLLKLGITPDLILLTRPHRQVATSLYRLATIPGRTEKGIKYLLGPEDPDVLPLPNWESLHDYQLCYWYCLEIERRSHKYRMMFAMEGACVVETCLRNINKVSGFNDLLQQLDLAKPNAAGWLTFLLIRNRRINAKTRTKEAVELPRDIDALEEEVLNIVRTSS